MDDKIDQLISIVENLLVEHEGLLDDSVRKQRALINGNIQEIEEIVARFAERVRTIQSLESARQQVGGALAFQWGVDLESLTMTFLTERVDGLRAQRMEGLLDQFTMVLAQIQEANERNRLLVEQSLSFVQYTMALLTETKEQDLVYGTNRPREAGGRLFDTRT